MPGSWQEIARSACRLCTEQANGQGVKIENRIEEPETLILVDPEQIKQVLVNILINAIQAQSGGGSITIESHVEEGKSVISIRDSGSGIKPEQLDSIFDPFFTTKRQGTGLGLSISYKLVKNNNGRIWATSEQGKGACFHISFPVKTNKP